MYHAENMLRSSAQISAFRQGYIHLGSCVWGFSAFRWGIFIWAHVFGFFCVSLGAFSFGRVCLGYVVCRIAEFGEVDSLDLERICIDGIDGVSEVEDWEWNMGQD